MNVSLLTHTNEAHWMMMPQALRRVFAFAARYNDSGLPAAVARNLELAFVAENPMLAVVVGHDDRGIVSAHLLLSIEPWAGEITLSILQYEGQGQTAADCAEGLRVAMAWGQKAGATKVEISARSDYDGDKRRMRLFKRYGFIERSVLMSAPMIVPEDRERQESTQTKPTIEQKARADVQ